MRYEFLLWLGCVTIGAGVTLTIGGLVGLVRQYRTRTRPPRRAA